MDLLQVLTRPSTLDDPVVIGGGQGDGFANAQIREGSLGGALEFRWVLECSCTNDAGLAAHQARNRVLGSNTARVRQRNRVAGVIIGSESSLTGALHHVLVGDQEISEAHVLGSLDSRHHKTAGPIGLRHIDRDTQVDVGWVNCNGFALNLVVEDVLAGELLESPDHRPGDEVGEGHFSTASPAQVVIDDDPVIDHQFCRHRANAGRCGNREALVHVGGQSFGHTLQGVDLVGGCFLGVFVHRGDDGGGRGGGFCGNGLLFGSNGGGFGNGGGDRRGVISHGHHRCCWGSRGGWRGC